MIETKTDDAYQLGTWVGRKQAFAALAGRCSAADAECMRQARDNKQYRALNMSWKEFCKQRLGLSRATANRIIERLEEFGPQYFILAQATGITPEQYRRISGSVRGQALLHAGQEIPIEAENAPRLAAAVEELRRETTPAEPETGPEDLTRAFDKVERTLAAAVTDLERLHALRLDGTERERLLNILLSQLRRLTMVQLTQLRLRS